MVLEKQKHYIFNTLPIPHPKHCSSIFSVLANSPHIDSCLNLSEMVMNTKSCPQQPKKASWQQPVVSSATNENVKNSREIWFVWHVDD